MGNSAGVSRLRGSRKSHSPLPTDGKVPASRAAHPVAMAVVNVLVVEDEENVRYVTSAALRSAGFAVQVQSNGRLALHELLQKSPPFDLAVLDIMLPDLDGLELCRRLRAEKVHVPVVFLTARSHSDYRIRGLTLGGDERSQQAL